MKNWLVSRYKHALFHIFIERWCWPVSNEKKINWINLRDNHYRNVVDFFKDKNDKLIIVNIEKKGKLIIQYFGLNNKTKIFI